MSSREPSLRLLPPWERSVSTVSCMLPSWWGAGRGGEESEGPHSQAATAPRQAPQGMGETTEDSWETLSLRGDPHSVEGC